MTKPQPLNKYGLPQAMKPAVKRAWIAALRSGKYKQGFGALRPGDSPSAPGDKFCPSAPGDKFCCLGVLCDISKKSKWSPDGTYIDSGAFLPPEVSRWAGLPVSKPCFITDNPESSFPGILPLTHLNDNLNYTFEEIADVIDYYF